MEAVGSAWKLCLPEAGRRPSVRRGTLQLFQSPNISESPAGDSENPASESSKAGEGSAGAVAVARRALPEGAEFLR
jgi:hypothetical protein